MDYAVNGDHSHSPDSLASSMNVKYGKGKVVKAEVNLKDKSTKQVKINGDASLAFPGESSFNACGRHSLVQAGR